MLSLFFQLRVYMDSLRPLTIKTVRRGKTAELRPILVRFWDPPSWPQWLISICLSYKGIHLDSLKYRRWGWTGLSRMSRSWDIHGYSLYFTRCCFELMNNWIFRGHMFRHTMGYVNGVGDPMMLILFLLRMAAFLSSEAWRSAADRFHVVSCFLATFQVGMWSGNTERERGRERERMCVSK